MEVRVRWERKRLKEKKGKRKQVGMGRFSSVSKDRDASFLNKALTAKHGSKQILRLPSFLKLHSAKLLFY